MSKQNIDIAMRGHDEGAGATVESVGMKLKMLNKEMRASGELSLERALKRGPEGFLDLLPHGAGAGLAAFGIDLAAQQLDKFAEKMIEVRKQFVEDKSDAGGMWDAVAEGVPVFGEVWKAGRSIHEALTGEKLEIELINEEAKLTTKYFETQQSRVEGVRKSLEGMNQELARSRGQQLVADAKTPFEGEIVGLKNAADQKSTQNQKDLNQDLVDNNKKLNEQRAVLKASQEEERAQFRNKYGFDINDDDLKGHASYLEDEGEIDPGEGGKVIAEAKQMQQRQWFERQQLEKANLDTIRNIKKTDADIQAQDDKTLESDITKAQKKEGDKEIEATTKKLEEKRKLSEEAANLELDTHSELRQQQLESLGDHLGAEEEKIRGSYQHRIDDAKGNAAAIKNPTEAEGYEIQAIRDKYATQQAEKEQQQEKQMQDRRAELQSQLAQRQAFHADLLSSRYQGFAEARKAEVEEANSAKILAELKDLNRNLGPERWQQSPGIPLR